MAPRTSLSMMPNVFMMRFFLTRVLTSVGPPLLLLEILMEALLKLPPLAEGTSQSNKGQLRTS